MDVIDDEGRVDADAALAFALATNDANPLYLDGHAVPPLFTAALVLPATWRVRTPEVRRHIIGARGTVHGEHDVYFRGAVKPGMSLRWEAENHSAIQTRGGVLETQRALVTDIDGAPLVEHLWSTFHMGGTIEDDLGVPVPDHTFPHEARGRHFARVTVGVDRDQAFRYAGVSGDHAPHAMSDEAARSEGYPSKILQGMCTFGLCSGAVVDAGAEGDINRLRRLAVRFSAPAFPSRDLVVDLYDAGRTEDGGRAFAFEATQDGVTVLKHGRAEFRPE